MKEKKNLEFISKGKKLRFIFFALMAWGEGISGGDKISIELARRWAKFFPITIYLWEEGYRMYTRQKLSSKNILYKIIDMNPWKQLGFIINYLARIIAGILIASSIKLENEKTTIVYSATEFWMDSLPGFILKIRFPKVTWIATWFQTAPSPWTGFKEGDRVLSYRTHALAYWLVQLPIKPLIKSYADFVLINNEYERKQFTEMDKKGKVIVVLGAVDLSLVKQLLNQIQSTGKVYDAVFQGRFHPQKGVVELIDIWKLVTDRKPDAKLALIGDGQLMPDVKQKIDKLNLQKNIKLFGYVLDGIKKYKIFAESKVVLHPAFYDSGGMAAAEAMALGLPAVGFDLKSYQSYYPAGMIKVPINNLDLFAKEILELLDNKKLYSETGNQAKEMISKNWSWDTRAETILNSL